MSDDFEKSLINILNQIHMDVLYSEVLNESVTFLILFGGIFSYLAYMALIGLRRGGPRKGSHSRGIFTGGTT